MKRKWRPILTIICLLYALTAVTAFAQSSPQETRKQACESLFIIVVQCQLSADPARDNCSEVSGTISSPQSKEIIAQRKLDGATDKLIEETLKLTENMCRLACLKARQGKIYKTSQEWIDDGGCTIQVK